MLQIFMENPDFFIKCRPYFRTFLNISQGLYKNVTEAQRQSVAHLLTTFIQQTFTQGAQSLEDPTMLDYIASECVQSKVMSEVVLA